MYIVETGKISYNTVNLIDSRNFSLVLTGSPLMNQLISAAGLELAEVQLTSTLSPSEYLSLPPVIIGPFFGVTRRENKI